MSKLSDHSQQLIDTYIKAGDIMGQGIIWLNRDGRILDVNEVFSEQLGYSKSELSTKSIFEVNPHFNLLRWRKLWKDLTTDGEIVIDTEHINADGKIFPVSLSGKHLRLDDESFVVGFVDSSLVKARFEDLLNFTCDLAQIGTWELSLVQGELTFSDEMFRALEMERVETLKKEDFQSQMKNFLTEDDLNELLVNLKNCILSGKSFETELSVKLPNGFVDKKLFVRPELNEIGETVLLRGLLQDISGLSERTNELYFMKFCMEHAAYGIFWANEEGKITYSNKAASKIYGYTARDFQSISPTDITTTTDYIWKEQFALVKKHSGKELRRIHKKKNGETFPVLAVNHFVAHRNETFVCTFVKDLTEEKERTQQLMLASETIRNSHDMIVWLNPDASFNFYNQTFAQTCGYTDAELENKILLDIIPATTLEAFQKGWEKLRLGKKMTAEREMVLKSGEKLPVEMIVSLVKVDGKEYSSTIFRDLTIQKSKEENLKNHAREIENLNAVLVEENVSLKEEIEMETNFGNIISTDKNYKQVLRQVAQVADTDATVLVLGETGTGKELLARAVHELSDRADLPMIKVNCGALPENLIESELFGHEKGSFTGAHAQKIGKFERADGGTIFLDEIGELPLDLQTQLLRVLQEGEIERVGGTKTITVDVRVVAATNRNLEEQVNNGKFREDLYYRLNVFPIYNIPLRERVNDIPVLAKHFVEKCCKRFNKHIDEIPAKVLKTLKVYDFPGNVRELENIIERSVIISKSNVLTFNENVLKSNVGTSETSSSKRFLTLDEAQTEHIISALKRTRGKVSGDAGAAKLLGINDKTLTSRMLKLEINKRDYLKK